MDDAAAALSNISALAGAALDKRLVRRCATPLIVAFSGGGDSLALLILAKAWADAAGRRLLAITIDHRLQASSEAWSAWCEARARRLGVEHRTLVWAGERPAAGLASAARAARHGLLAQTARVEGASVVLMGHTADDALEAMIMRAEGASVAAPREWSPSPLWPAGRNIFTLRPLIAVRRADLRRTLREIGESWIDDPANDDLRQPRARARAALAKKPSRGSPTDAILPREAGKEPCFQEGAAGDLTVSRHLLLQGDRGVVRRRLGATLLCAAGTSRPPRGESLDRLVRRLSNQEDFVATLAGAQLEAAGAAVHIMREAGAACLVGDLERPLALGAIVIWDGRFEVEARAGGLLVAPLDGLGKRLDRATREALKAVAPAARRGLPAVIDRQNWLACPTLRPDPRVAIRSLVSARLAGALGLVDGEAAIQLMAQTPWAT